MAETGYNWGSWAFAKDDGGTDWDADALADNATEVSNTAISLDGKASCEIAIAAYEDNTGAIDGNVTVYVLGNAGDMAYEETTIGNPLKFQFTPVQNDTVYVVFPIDAKHYDSIKIAVKNESGQELAISVKYNTTTVPAAS